MKAKILIVVFLLFVAGAVALFWWIRSHGFSARAEPSWIEKKLAQHARRMATPADAKEMKNPFPETEASLTEAREHFVEHCSMCHGIDGRGQTAIGRNLYPKVPLMTDADTQQLTDGELFYIISNGVRFTGMPAWGGEDIPESLWGLSHLSGGCQSLRLRRSSSCRKWLLAQTIISLQKELDRK